MAATVLGRQGQLDEGADRAAGAQHRVGQLEQRVTTSGQAVVEPAPESRQVDTRIDVSSPESC
ncbi:hypothetical protein YT1_0117 [Rhodococcus ruber]|nr:hypothetical protein YT1_0117 [Rhodococcus ruber]